MEKPVSTMRTIKGSTSSAAEVITVDPEALCCPRCFHPLVPPVFQCAAGHLVCSTCHDNLPDKNKCVSCFISTGYSRCFIPTSYSRCHGVERILRSVRVACPNTMYGCSAGKMLYHEKTEHEKICPAIAGSGGLPRGVVKMGPCGGGEGDARDMDVRGVDRVVKVVVWYRVTLTLDAMSVLYERDGREEKTDDWGLPPAPGKCSEICLETEEYLTGVKGHVGRFQDLFIVRSLTFVTNRRTYGPYGVEEGEPFELSAAGGRIIGFHGRSGKYLDALGTYVKMAI